MLSMTLQCWFGEDYNCHSAPVFSTTSHPLSETSAAQHALRLEQDYMETDLSLRCC